MGTIVNLQEFRDKIAAVNALPLPYRIIFLRLRKEYPCFQCCDIVLARYHNENEERKEYEMDAAYCIHCQSWKWSISEKAARKRLARHLEYYHMASREQAEKQAAEARTRKDTNDDERDDRPRHNW